MQESKVIISFDYADNGIYNFNGPLKDFEIAGEDEIFYEAKAKIYGESIIVESPNGTGTKISSIVPSAKIKDIDC